MKLLILICNIVLCSAIYFISSLAPAIHRAHAISTAVEIVKSYNVAETNQPAIEKLVASVGNTTFYYSTICDVAVFGFFINLIVLIVALIKQKKLAEK